MTFNPSGKDRRPGAIASVGLVRTMIKLGHARSVTVALTAIRDVDPGGNSAVLLYTDWLLNPLFKAVAQFPALDAPTLAAILRKHRPFHVMDAAERLARAEKRSISTVAREMFAAAIAGHLARMVSV